MQLSLQASGRDFPRSELYPFRVTIWQRLNGGEWTMELVYEVATEGEGHEDAEAVLAAYGGDGIEMHYYVGEVG